MSFMGFPVDSLSAAVPVMLLVSTLEDFVFILIVQRQRKTLIGTIQKLLIPSFYTSLTTCVGFLTLCLSDLSIVRRLGLICGLGAMIEWAIVFLIFPRIIILIKSRQKENFKFVSIHPQILKPFTYLADMKLSKWICWVSILPIIYVLWFFQGKLKVEDSPEAVFPQSHPVPVATKKLLDGRDWKSEISLVFTEKLEPEQKEKLVQKIMQENPDFIGYEGLDQTKEFLLRPIQRQSLSDLVSDFINQSQFAARWVSADSDLERIILLSKTTDVVKINKIRENVSLICKDNCYLAHILVSYSEFGLKILSTLTESFSLSVILVCSLLFFLSLYLKTGNIIPILLSAVWGPFTLLFGFMYFDIGIYFATSVVMAVLVGLAGDNAIQFLFSAQNGSLKKAVQDLGLASIITMVLMLVISSGFLFSDFGGVQKIGIMMMIGFVLGWIGDLVVLRGLLK
jgi:predicted RND superfamily exporter protein